jgi:drug/metabolite transporter (DMT)-like permease
VPQNPPHAPAVVSADWLLLVLLSLVWGASFIFVGIAVKELPTLLIVLVRVGLAALILLPVHWLWQGALPTDARSWMAFAGVSLTNNIIPFTLIVYGQHTISASLASVLNATTPFFGLLVMALAGLEGLTGRKVMALLLGLLGVAVLRGVDVSDFNQETVGILACLGASLSYGVGSLWQKKRVMDVPPITSATGQLVCSTVFMAALALAFSTPQQLLGASAATWTALILLAALSTSVAYLLFFKIITRSGPTAANLVTMMIPVSAIIMAALWLGERIALQEVAGALMIGLGLIVYDGRLLDRLKIRAA